MNERIGKLAVEAGAHWDHGDWNMPSAVYFSEGDLEKFAELIVKECGRVYIQNQQDGVMTLTQDLLHHFLLKNEPTN